MSLTTRKYFGNFIGIDGGTPLYAVECEDVAVGLRFVSRFVGIDGGTPLFATAPCSVLLVQKYQARFVGIDGGTPIYAVACCGETECVDTCPDHAAVTSYSAVVGDHSMTLTSPDENCNFLGSDCIVETPSVTNDWEYYWGDYDFPDIECECIIDGDCCQGYQQPGFERAPESLEIVQSGYEQNDHWKRWEQERESTTVQLYDVGGGNLRVLVTVLKEILYMIGVNTAIRAGYRVATVTLCTPRYVDSGPTDLPEIPCEVEYAAAVWDAWPAQPDPDYPECNVAESNPDGCEFTTGPHVDVFYTLEADSVGPFDSVYCFQPPDDVPSCVATTFNYTKAVSRLYEMYCNADAANPLGWNCFGVHGNQYAAFGYYYYYSDPFPCDAFPSNPIALKREPYTDIAATTNYESVCGQSYPYRTPFISKDLEITLT